MNTPRNGISLYIYILYLYFSGFFVFFDVFCPILDFIDFLCTIPMFFDVFCRVVFPSLIWPFFGFDFFGPIQRDGIWFLSIFRFLAFFNFWPFFIDPFFGFIFYRFFIVFLGFFEILFFERFLSNVASVGRFLFCEKPEKVEKSRKNDVFWGPKKRVKVGPFCTTPIFGQKSCFLAS